MACQVSTLDCRLGVSRRPARTRYSRHALALIDGLARGVAVLPAIVSLIEIVRAWADARRAPAAITDPADATGDVSFIVCANLPNERGVLVDTVEVMLTIATPGASEVLVAYNGAGDHLIEERLRTLAERDPRLRTLRVTNSSSKASNLACAIARAQYGIIAVFDADCRPETGSVSRAIAALARGAEVVQGAPAVAHTPSLLSRLVASELRHSYQNSKPARGVDGVAYFSGSNAYWRRDVLQALGVSSQCLTEDIELSMRAVVSGVQFVYDPAVRCSETAPASLGGWWNQRRRWMWGWLQSSALHGTAVLRTQRGRRRLWWAYLMLGRRHLPALGIAWLATRRRLRVSGVSRWALLTLAVDWLGDRRALGRFDGPSMPAHERFMVPAYELLRHAATLSAMLCPPRDFKPTPRPPIAPLSEQAALSCAGQRTQPGFRLQRYWTRPINSGPGDETDRSLFLG